MQIIKRRLLIASLIQKYRLYFIQKLKRLYLPNPISVEMSAMRVSLLSGLLGAVLYNQNRQQNRVRLFETGLRFCS